MNLVKPDIDLEGLAASIINCMPTEGDTSVNDVRCALRERSLGLELANLKYMKTGGASFYLFQETRCKIVIRLKLTNLKKEEMIHFVAWDGEKVYDKPYDIIIDREKDLATKKASTLAFGKLYPKTEFFSWQITAVYQLVSLR